MKVSAQNLAVFFNCLTPRQLYAVSTGLGNLGPPLGLHPPPLPREHDKYLGIGYILLQVEMRTY